MEDRLGELLQFGKDNPFMNEPNVEPQEPFMDQVRPSWSLRDLYSLLKTLANN